MTNPPSLPQSENTLLIRTDFSDETAWQALRTAVSSPNEDGFVAYVHVIDDRAWRDLTAEQLVALAGVDQELLFVADGRAVTDPEMPLLAVMRADEDDAAPARGHEELRVAAAHLSAVENNLSMTNMDWEEFVDAAGEDGVFRGF
ncbi:hypothetical protein DI272_15005 [Streptomyces sp. Act143]|uniref:DUF6924 domain-containing protein n=1 Tax=Streptomyces sp. Act143 TaxID=2200760 RepID=UPI000D67405C|nr:hypothetical protein [Streptomyces sp. Act143]PWI15329.1 hypothetical protein DI272_15005 [Streptomyces sp. Act143]